MILGWREWVGLPDLIDGSINAKIDTGAKSCALHAVNVRQVAQGGFDFVEFLTWSGGDCRKSRKFCIAPLLTTRTIRSSNGEAQERFVVDIDLCIGQQRVRADVTLADRSEMTHQMLIGRDVLGGRFIVDPSLSYATDEK